MSGSEVFYIITSEVRWRHFPLFHGCLCLGGCLSIKQKEHYMLARRYEFYVLVARTISHSNIKFISSRHRVISFMTSWLLSYLQSEIPRHHRSREAHSRHNRRAERGRYRSVLAVGVGCAVAGGWICLATVVYVVRYLRAKRNAAARGAPSDNLMWNTAFYRRFQRFLTINSGCDFALAPGVSEISWKYINYNSNGHLTLFNL